MMQYARGCQTNVPLLRRWVWSRAFWIICFMTSTGSTMLGGGGLGLSDFFVSCCQNEQLLVLFVINFCVNVGSFEFLRVHIVSSPIIVPDWEINCFKDVFKYSAPWLLPSVAMRSRHPAWIESWLLSHPPTQPHTHTHKFVVGKYTIRLLLFNLTI